MICGHILCCMPAWSSLCCRFLCCTSLSIVPLSNLMCIEDRLNKLALMLVAVLCTEYQGCTCKVHMKRRYHQGKAAMHSVAVEPREASLACSWEVITCPPPHPPSSPPACRQNLSPTTSYWLHADWNMYRSVGSAPGHEARHVHGSTVVHPT